MNLPNSLTLTRIILAPVVFILLWIPEWFAIQSLTITIIAIVLFFLIEITDLADGFIARKFGLVTDLGKLLDPFSDVFSRITYFVTFLAFGILNPIFCLIILYREFSMIFIRMILAQKGIALAAKSGGKLKSVFYFLASFVAMGFILISRGGFLLEYHQVIRLSVDILFAASALLALISFVDYLIIFLKKMSEISRM
jgi:CDP-diacylglycerol--glycerol-3-phosphate 3-phosphatidyltransferase